MDQKIGKDLRDTIIRTEVILDEMRQSLLHVPDRLVKLELWSDVHEIQDTERFAEIKLLIKRNRMWLLIIVGVGLIGLGSTLGFTDGIKFLTQLI